MADKPRFTPARMSKFVAEETKRPVGAVTPEPKKAPVTSKKPVISPPPMRLPNGFMYLWNRTNRPFTYQYDNQDYTVEAYEFAVLPEDIARHLYVHSIMKLATTTTNTIRALALEEMEDGGWCVPLGEYDWEVQEIFDRENDPNPAERGTGGLKTKPVVMQVK